MEFFQTLGSVVSSRWKTRSYNEEVFPEIATRALAELPPADHVSLWDVVRWGMAADQLPRQDDIEATFGDPPLTAYTGRKFRIEVLFWIRGVPTIHQHGFSGAFHVMSGSSIHTLWEFQPTEQIETGLIIGRVTFKNGEILLKGDSRPILAGNALFHSTYHLDRPSISVVIRTLSEADKQPQYNLLPPSIAYDPKNEIATVKRQTQILQMLLKAGKRAEFNQITRHVCATKDAYSIFQFLHSAFSLIEDETERQDLLLTARLKHGHLIDAIQPALLRQEVEDRILTLRGNVYDIDLRFFLALLRNIPERSSILRLIEQRFPDREPTTVVVDLVRRLSESGLLPTRLEEPSLLLLQHVLLGHSAKEVLRDLDARYQRERIPSIAELRGACSILQASWLLRSLGLINPFDSGTNSPVGHAVRDNATMDSGVEHGHVAPIRISTATPQKADVQSRISQPVSRS